MANSYQLHMGANIIAVNRNPGNPIRRQPYGHSGRDERLSIASYYKGVDFYYRFLKAVAS